METMESGDEESGSSDIEELEFALYSQIHYNSYTENHNDSQAADPISSAEVNAHYDIDVKSANGTCTYKPIASLSNVSLSGVKDRKFDSVCTSQEDSAIGLESFMSVNSTETLVIIKSDSEDCSEENSKVTEVLCKDKQSKISSAKESVIEIDSDSEQEIDWDRKNNVILLTDSDSENSDLEMCDASMYSDDMLLDEDLSDLEGLHVNVDKEHQPKLSSAYNFEHHQKTWFIIDADKYGTVPQHAKNRYYGNKFDRCHNCKQHGHLANSCLKPSKLEICILCGFIGHFHKYCEQRACYRCDCPGHLTRDCQERTVSKWSPCHRCGRKGHSQRTCPEQWRQYHLTTSMDSPQKGRNKKNHRKYCYNCAEEGHYGFECKEQRMDRYSVCSYPFVQRYDFSTVKKSRKREANEGDEESYEKKAKKVKLDKPEGDSLEDGKKKKSKKLKRIYKRLETERLQGKGKKKKSAKLKKPTQQSDGNESIKLTDDERSTSVKENVHAQTVNVKKSKDKKSKKLKRIYDRIQTERQEKKDNKKRFKEKQESGNWNPNWQRMKNSMKGSCKSDLRNNQRSNRKNFTGFNGIPINASKGFKSRFTVKQ